MYIDVQRDEGGLNRYFVRYVKLDFIRNKYVWQRQIQLYSDSSGIKKARSILHLFLMVCCMWPCYEVRWMVHVQCGLKRCGAWYRVVCYIK